MFLCYDFAFNLTTLHARPYKYFYITCMNTVSL